MLNWITQRWLCAKVRSVEDFRQPGNLQRWGIVNGVELAKHVIYRTPVLSRLMAPKYPYKVDPAQLCAMLEFIDLTRGTGAAVAEIGVAQGDSSTFILEHLKTTRDDRILTVRHLCWLY